MKDNVKDLKEQIIAQRTKLVDLETKLAQAECVTPASDPRTEAPGNESITKPRNHTWPLTDEEFLRYGRQMIVPGIGLEGQARLKHASALIVGVGGLGCPAAAYLAGAGVGTIGLVDDDVVELSNLHRQILHNITTLGLSKVDSAVQQLSRQNPLVSYVPHRERLSAVSAPDVFSHYDIVLDCTDQPSSRYLISDTAVLLKKPLVSASALRAEGQLMVLNNPPLPPGNASGGPCYRCVFPNPPTPESVTSCGDGGILGPIVGAMGVLQATEAIKLIVNGPRAPASLVNGELLLYSAFDSPSFRSVRLRSRSHKCLVCSKNASITIDSLISGSLDYAAFCGTPSPLETLSPEERIEAWEYESIRNNPTKRHALLDVREKAHFDICNLNGSINLPISSLSSMNKEVPDELVELRTSEEPIYVVCRLGNDSQLAVKILKSLGLDRGGGRYVGDIKGGFNSWKQTVDQSWPEY